MRPRRSAIVVCLLALAFAQGCLGAAPPATRPPDAGTPSPGATTSAAAPTPTDGSTATPATASQPPPATAPNASGPATAAPTPRPTGSTPVAGPTPTAPRLGLDPPGTPPPGTPPASAPPTAAAAPPAAVREATIAQVQGTGARSPLALQTVRLVGAIVTADFQQAPLQGFFVQERIPSSQDASTGIFVYQGDRPTPDVKLGDEVTLVGVVRESYDRTELDISLAASGVVVVSSGNPLPPPIDLRPPATEAEARAYLERYEGMLVALPTAIVVGPTTQFGEFTVVRADTGARRLFQGEARGAGWRLVVNDEGGARYDVAVGDAIEGIVGPLDYSFGLYKIAQLPEPRLAITAPPRMLPAFPPAGDGEFTVATFNLANFFDPTDTPGKADPCDRDDRGVPCAERVTAADYALKTAKAGQAIRNVLGGPTLVAVQEVESLDVLTALAAAPDLAPLGYGAVLLEGLDPRGIDVGLLYRRDRVTITSVAQRNACTTKNYGFTDAEARCSTRGDGTLDGYFLAARPPLVVGLTVRGPGGDFALTLVICHFKSKGGTDPENKEFVSRRTDEARLVAGIVNDLLAADPGAAIAVVGDLNDFADSPPLRALTTDAPLQNLVSLVPAAERYSYIYNGLAQVLDHILVTPRLRALLVRVAFAHFDADFPDSLSGQPVPNRVSDHDPPLARFRLP